ncbi:hypothetical protein [Bowmanella sp. JS7-9]|uniref:HNH endonuclease n=1 Tax=Pseudobowmanella zhangzhouensis TaxID=1537679 RepID=A0ABW1XJB7_9ALTE|nr:hypothetical protein [Bowmanella sp. JS7-9]TBX27390.1 hypothetical protein TK45_01170 [Bowmanella sp. JS7-9]
MKVHQSYGKQTFDSKACFLCGEHLGGSKSVEHVFPKWLQNKYDLWNQKIGLLNGSLLSYRQLTIPCCKRCNNEHLSRVEDEVSAAVKGGFLKTSRLPVNTWYLWAGKIFYGILRKELTLLSERSEPYSGTIVSEDILKSFSNLHLFMQGLRGRHEFCADVPYSVLVCNLHEFGGAFDFRDNLFLSTVAIRMGETGVIVSFEDGGITKESYGRYVTEVDGSKLHPIQFYELYAKITYQMKLRQKHLSYVTQTHVDGHFVASTEVIRSSSPLDNWNSKEFVELLSCYISPWLSEKEMADLFDQVRTWMVNENGKPLLLSREEWESPTIQ